MYNAGDAKVSLTIDPESVKRATEHMETAMERVKLLGLIEELRVECAAANDTAKQWQDMYNAERMRATTCPCGHVGAECFNDSYCEPETLTAGYWLKRFQNAQCEIEAMRDVISDLQADYARDTQAWQNVYNANEEANDKVYQEQTDRIEALETTIRVLTGMID